MSKDHDRRSCPHCSSITVKIIQRQELYSKDCYEKLICHSCRRSCTTLTPFIALESSSPERDPYRLHQAKELQLGLGAPVVDKMNQDVESTGDPDKDCVKMSDGVLICTVDDHDLLLMPKKHNKVSDRCYKVFLGDKELGYIDRLLSFTEWSAICPQGIRRERDSYKTCLEILLDIYLTKDHDSDVVDAPTLKSGTTFLRYTLKKSRRKIDVCHTCSWLRESIYHVHLDGEMLCYALMENTDQCGFKWHLAKHIDDLFDVISPPRLGVRLSCRNLYNLLEEYMEHIEES